MKCPRCRTALNTSHFHDIEIHTCAACGGEFVPGAMLPRILEMRRTEFDSAMLLEVEGREPVYGVPAEELDEDVACPACSAAMRPLNYAGDTAVIVDRCDGCDGVWLDQKELDHIQAILNQWDVDAQGRLALISHRLEAARQDAAAAGDSAFQGSRFSFINAIVNRLLDAA